MSCSPVCVLGAPGNKTEHPLSAGVKLVHSAPNAESGVVLDCEERVESVIFSSADEPFAYSLSISNGEGFLDRSLEPSAIASRPAPSISRPARQHWDCHTNSGAPAPLHAQVLR